MKSSLILAFLRPSRPPHLTVFVALVGAVLPVCRGGAADEGPRQLQPTIVVRSSPQTLHIAAVVPKGKMSEPVDAACGLVEIGGSKAEIPTQWVPGTSRAGAEGQPALAASIPPRSGVVGPRRFRLAFGRIAGESPSDFRFKEISENSLGLWDGDKPVLVYNHGVITNEGVPNDDKRRSRACYIHPVYGLDGEVITDDFPKDHYHHHGVFWCWPHVGIDGKEYDLWVYNNIGQRFVRWLGRKAGPVAAALGVENGWFVGERKVMIERVWLRVYKPSGKERSMDLEFTWSPVDRPITLRGAEGKSYGGLCLRYAPRPEKETLITVPVGKTTEDLPDTPLSWADLTAKFPGAPALGGAAIFVDPLHPDFPPPWLTRHYGILCVGWPGVKGRTFRPGEPIRLNYRVWIHEDSVEPAVLQEAFDAYAAGRKVMWE